MNENIVRLIAKANEGLDGVAAGTMAMEDSSFDAFMERFAALIIQRCVLEVDVMNMEDEYNSLETKREKEIYQKAIDTAIERIRKAFE